jgi:hypothetical protein
MHDEPLRPATAEEVAATLSVALRHNSLSVALRHNSQRRVHAADRFMAQITAERLVQYLEWSGFVVMKRPPETLA